MKLIHYGQSVIQEIDGKVYIDGKPRRRFSSAEQLAETLHYETRSRKSLLQQSVRGIVGKIVSENVNSVTMSDGDVTIAMDEALNEELSTNRLTVELRRSTNTNPFQKFQFVLESGEKVSISEGTLNTLIAENVVPRSLGELVRYI